MPSENATKTLRNGWIWVTNVKLLGSSISLSHWQLQSLILLDHLLTSWWNTHVIVVPKNPDINPGKCLFQNEHYSIRTICYQQWMFQTYSRTFASASSWHVNIEIMQRVKDLDRAHPLFPSPMWDLQFEYVLHDDATTTDQMIPITQTQLSNNPENMWSSCLLEHAGIYFGKRSNIKRFERKRTNYQEQRMNTTDVNNIATKKAW